MVGDKTSYGMSDAPLMMALSALETSALGEDAERAL